MVLRRLFVTIMLLAPLADFAHAEPSTPVSEFIALAKASAKTREAADALQNGPPEEFFRWGKETCTWVRAGNANFQEATANLKEFFGEDLAAALVFASRRVICPDLK